MQLDHYTDPAAPSLLSATMQQQQQGGGESNNGQQQQVQGQGGEMPTFSGLPTFETSSINPLAPGLVADQQFANEIADRCVCVVASSSYLSVLIKSCLVYHHNSLDGHPCSLRRKSGQPLWRHLLAC